MFFLVDRANPTVHQELREWLASANLNLTQHLSKHDYFVGDRYTIADIALYAYTHVAEEGNFDLSRFPAILAWFVRVASALRNRVASQPNYLTILAN
jgi:glutathione S-transferase